MTRLPVWGALLALRLFAADSRPDPKLDALLRNIESRYNRTQSLKLDFSETYAGISHAPSHTEAGTLYLKKPGRMRWEYSFPAGKLFLSDGKDVLLYTPDEHRAQKSKLKASEDMRAPLAFLLGKLDFAKEFKSFETRPEGQNTWIIAQPKNPNVEFTQVEFLAAPNGEILKLRVTGITNAKIDFTFGNEMLNVPVSADRFIFQPPPGVEVVEGDQE